MLYVRDGKQRGSCRNGSYGFVVGRCTSEGSVNGNLATLVVDSGASGHYFDNAIIHNLKHRLQDYAHLATPRKILTTGGAVLQGLTTDDNGNQVLVRVDIIGVPGIRHNLFSVRTTAKNSIATIFDYRNPRLKGSNVTVPLRRESGDLDLFTLDLSVDQCGAKELAMNAVANAQVWHQWLGHLHAQSMNILRKREGPGITFEGALSDRDVCTVGKAQ